MSFMSEDSSDNEEDTRKFQQFNNAKREDLKEEFGLEMPEYSNRKRPHESSSSSPSSGDDSDDDAPEVVRESSHASSPPIKMAKTMTAAESIMAKMGYQEGKGLGRDKQGRSAPIELSTQRGRIGLGHESNKALGRDLNEVWDESKESKEITEKPLWIEATTESREQVINALQEDIYGWASTGQKKLKIDDEDKFCNLEVLKSMLKAKDVFDNLTDRELNEARSRANPYETIGSAFFQNRAAMKTANLDKVFDWIFSGEEEKNLAKKNPTDGSKPQNCDRSKEVFYFADVCAGPGGFSEYMLWRKGFYNAKGFGFTLRNKDDFKLGKFTASSAYYFEPYYGKKGNGDVTDPENIDALEDFIQRGTNHRGVNLMMADGGFSVDGQENIQEILSKRLYLCQLLVSLCIVKEGGNFFCKLFDIFTPFSAGLVYLMYVCYEKISLHKPHTSRPANSERYIICQGLRKEYSDIIRDYLKKINRKLDKYDKEGQGKDITDIVDLDVIKDNEEFFEYLVNHNEMMAIRQTVYLDKYRSFAKNQGQIDKDQGNLREDCMKYWKVPLDRQKVNQRGRDRHTINPGEVFGKFSTKMMSDEDFNQKPPLYDDTKLQKPMDKQLKYAEYQLAFLGERISSSPRILVSNGDKVYVRGSHGWDERDYRRCRIPADTILLVDFTTPFKLENGRVSKGSTDSLIRIIDAAVLNGDDVTKLTYENRMKAAEKFCKALKMVEPKFKVGWGHREETVTAFNLVTAKHFGIEELEDYKSRMVVTKLAGEVFVGLREREEDDFLIQCRAVRFTRILSEDWYLAWSNSQQLKYAFDKKKSIFEKDFESHGCNASFWDTSLIKKSQPARLPMQFVWKWDSSLQDNYGPRVILDEESHPSGPTISSLMALAREQNQRCGRDSHF